MAGKKQGIIFISCGQYRPEEKKLGQELADAVNDLTEFEGYFAENQTTLEGLSSNIFGALNRCCGFVAVMHSRGEVATPNGTHIRASVWVEQEIAIAAFLRQAQDRKLDVVVYLQKGVGREGVRDQLSVHPVAFDTEDQVLTDFVAKIRDGKFKPTRLPPPKELTARIEWRTNMQSSELHQYFSELFVANSGDEEINDYWAELQFPTAVMNTTYPNFGLLNARVTATHTILRVNREIIGVPLYPGDEQSMIQVTYHMDSLLFQEGSVLDLPVIARCGSPGMTTREVRKAFRDLQNF